MIIFLRKIFLNKIIYVNQDWENLNVSYNKTIPKKNELVCINDIYYYVKDVIHHVTEKSIVIVLIGYSK